MGDSSPEETAWMIEMAIDGWPHWYAFSADSYWTPNPDEGIRFARQDDAEAVILHFGLVDARATSHMWK